MAAGRAEAKIAKDPDAVWDLVGNFGGLAEWMPGMESCELDGDIRKLKTMGLEIHEQLHELDDDGRRISYAIVQSPMPLEHHLATITVEPAAGGSLVTWAYEVVPDEMLGAFGPVYEQSLQAAKAKLEG
jgi:hypothetical protein